MRSTVRTFFFVLVVVALGQGANGLQNDLIALKAAMMAFSMPAIGAMMAMYYAGFSVAALNGHRVIGNHAHVRTIAFCLVALGGIILVHPLLLNPWFWAALRFATGFAISLFDISIESWINAQTRNGDRGRTFSFYMMVQIVALAAAQYILSLGSPTQIGLFVVAAVLFFLGAVAILPARRRAPVLAPPQPLRMHRLFAISRLGACAVLLAGFAWAVIFMFGPVYAQRCGLSVAGIGLFMGVAIGAGALMQIPAGWLSDLIGRKIVIAALFVGGLLVAIVGLLAPHVDTRVILAVAALCGGFSFPIYAVASACINDAIKPKERVSAAAGVLLLFGLGSIAGPLLCGWAMNSIGPSGYYAILVGAMLLGTLLALGIKSTNSRQDETTA